MKQLHLTKRHIILTLALSLTFACEEATDWDYETGDNGKLVVEAIITNELRHHEIFLSLTYDDINGTPPAGKWCFGKNEQRGR